MPTTAAPTPAPAARVRPRRWAWALAGAAVLALVFLLYTEPGFVVMMADQVWACF